MLLTHCVDWQPRRSGGPYRGCQRGVLLPINVYGLALPHTNKPADHISLSTTMWSYLGVVQRLCRKRIVRHLTAFRLSTSELPRYLCMLPLPMRRRISKSGWRSASLRNLIGEQGGIRSFLMPYILNVTKP